MTKSAVHMLKVVPKLFGKREDGAVLVEFAIVFPVMLLVFGVTVESARMFWNYQKAVSGVRDASRYLGRAAPFDICDGSTWSGVDTTLREKIRDIIEEDILGNDLFVSKVSINRSNVTYSVTCIDDSGPTPLYDANTVIIGTVTAELTMQFPLASIFEFFSDGMSSVTTTLSDQVRIYGQ